jgi:hypothetical protein
VADVFDEQSLLADIESTWGAYGAHADVCRMMIAEVERLRFELEKQRTAHEMWFKRAYDLEEQLEEARRAWR